MIQNYKEKKTVKKYLILQNINNLRPKYHKYSVAWAEWKRTCSVFAVEKQIKDIQIYIFPLPVKFT